MIGRRDFYSISFVAALLIFIQTPLFLLYFFVSLSYYILAVPMRECFGKHSCMSSFPVAILNGICLFPTVQPQVHNGFRSEKL